MSYKEIDGLIAEGSTYASQFKKLQKFDERLKVIDDEYNESTFTLRCNTMVDKSPIFNQLREVYASIPEFWVTAISNIPIFAAPDSGNRAELVNYVYDVEVVYDPKTPTAGKITFHFDENPVCKELSITREIFNRRTSEDTNELMVKVPEIEWKKNQGPSAQPQGELTFMSWLVESTPCEADFYFLQEFYPSAANFYRGIHLNDDYSDIQDYTDDEHDAFEEEEEEYQSDEDLAPPSKKPKNKE